MRPKLELLDAEIVGRVLDEAFLLLRDHGAFWRRWCLRVCLCRLVDSMRRSGLPAT